MKKHHIFIVSSLSFCLGATAFCGFSSIANTTNLDKSVLEVANTHDWDIRTFAYVQGDSSLPEYDRNFLAPNFQGIYSVAKTDEETPSNINVDQNGWATSNNSYLQLFLNEKVARFFAGENGDINSTFNQQTALQNLNQANGVLNLSGFYLIDPQDTYPDFNKFADDTIKCLNNPNLSAIWNQVNELDLTNNQLWYLPSFGFNSTQIVDRIAFYNNLSQLNLSNNHLTILPSWNEGTIVTFHYDLSVLPAMEENGINLSYNFLMEDPTIEANVPPVLARDPLENPSKVTYDNQLQSSWIYINSDNFSDYISQSYKQNGHDIANLYLKDNDIGINQQITVGEAVTSQLTSYLQDNYLCSNFLFGQDQSQFSWLSSDAYLFAQINNAKGAQMFSCYFKNFQTVTPNENGQPQISKKSNVYLNFNVSGFAKSNAVGISVIVICFIVVIVLFAIFVYQLFIKKRLIAKKKAKIAKQLSEIESFVKDVKKPDSADK